MEERQREKSRSEGSGSFIGVDIDTNGDGDKGGLTTGVVKSNLGQFALSFLSETVLVPRTTCPVGTLEFSLVVQRIVLRDQRGDLLYGEGTSWTQCFDPVARTLSATGTLSFIGGTGRYVGASGEIEGSLNADVLLLDPTTGQAYGAGTSEFEGTLNLVK